MAYIASFMWACTHTSTVCPSVYRKQLDELNCLRYGLPFTAEKRRVSNNASLLVFTKSVISSVVLSSRQSFSNSFRFRISHKSMAYILSQLHSLSPISSTSPLPNQQQPIAPRPRGVRIWRIQVGHGTECSAIVVLNPTERPTSGSLLIHKNLNRSTMGCAAGWARASQLETFKSGNVN